MYAIVSGTAKTVHAAWSKTIEEALNEMWKLTGKRCVLIDDDEVDDSGIIHNMGDTHPVLDGTHWKSWKSCHNFVVFKCGEAFVTEFERVGGADIHWRVVDGWLEWLEITWSPSCKGKTQSK